MALEEEECVHTAIQFCKICKSTIFSTQSVKTAVSFQYDSPPIIPLPASGGKMSVGVYFWFYSTKWNKLWTNVTCWWTTFAVSHMTAQLLWKAGSNGCKNSLKTSISTQNMCQVHLVTFISCEKKLPSQYLKLLTSLLFSNSYTFSFQVCLADERCGDHSRLCTIQRLRGGFSTARLSNGRLSQSGRRANAVTAVQRVFQGKLRVSIYRS